MKVTWHEEDIKAGIEVGTSHQAPMGVIAFIYVADEGPRYTLVLLNTYEASEPLNKSDMAAYLTVRGYKPASVLTP